MSKEKKVESDKQMEELAEDFIKSLKPYKNKAKVVFLKGELGAGKTTFTRGVLQVLGVKKNVTSPTFVLMKKYVLDNKDFKTLYHIDAYRLKEKDGDILGINNLEKHKANLIFIEWPERLYKKISKEAVVINFLHGKLENERVVRFS